MEPNTLQNTIDARYRVLIILWAAFLLSLVIYFVIAQFTTRANVDDGQGRILTFMFTAAGTLMAIVSTVIRQKFVSQAEDFQRPHLVNTGYVIAFAFCETAGILGLMDHMLTGNRYYYVLLIIGAIGLISLWPQRDHLLRAYYKK
jgi:peptidoglycan/LPS O-acetylase OafA/YrhL